MEKGRFWMGISRHIPRIVSAIDIELKWLYHTDWQGATHTQLFFGCQIGRKTSQEIGKGVKVELSCKAWVSESRILGYGGGFLGGEGEEIEAYERNLVSQGLLVDGEVFTLIRKLPLNSTNNFCQFYPMPSFICSSSIRQIIVRTRVTFRSQLLCDPRTTPHHSHIRRPSSGPESAEFIFLSPRSKTMHADRSSQ